MCNRITAVAAAAVFALLALGCMESLSEQATKKDPGNIIGKKTQKIGKFDPNANREVSDSKVHVDPTPLYAMQAYGPIMEQVSKLGVDHAVDLFYAENARYPKDYDEFMTRIIKANNIQLPVLPAQAEYQYDEKNHKLVVVKAPDRDAAPKADGVDK